MCEQREPVQMALHLLTAIWLGHITVLPSGFRRGKGRLQNTK